MAKISITKMGYKCERCNHEWLPRDITSKLDKLNTNLPKVCPKCKSPYWDTPRKKTER